MTTTKKSELLFLAGPFDGWKVREDPSFKQHYYVPIKEKVYHYYERNDSTYMYRGEVEVISTG